MNHFVTTIWLANIEFDPIKSSRNETERGLSFELASDFDFTTALTKIDDRHDYGEVRYASLGLIDGRLHSLVYTLRSSGIRVISLRKGNNREIAIYEQET
jgi:uncharacterized DUF497 family protein